MKAYESITFEVERNLEKPKCYLKKKPIKLILNDLFQKRKTRINPRTGEEIYLRENEPLEIFHSTFDTKEEEIYNFEKRSLIKGLITAYKNHYPITITPDMIWLLIAQAFHDLWKNMKT